MSELDTATKALLEAQKAIGKVSKNQENPFHKSKYADYSAVFDAVKGPLNENGFIIMHRGVTVDGKEYLRTVLLHTSGGSFESQFPLVVDGNPQHAGSFITYLKRYNLAALTGLATEGEDDDGNAASKLLPHGNKQSTPANAAVGHATAPLLHDADDEPPTDAIEPEVVDEVDAKLFPPKENVDKISEAQSKRLYAIWKSAKKPDSLVKDWLLHTHGIASSKDIPKSMYNKICEEIVKI